MTTTADRVSVLVWLVPATVLAAAGLGKVVSPEGVPPQDLGALPFGLSYGAALRLLGFAEVVVAGALVARRSRRPARWAALGLLVAFSTFLSLHADDARFVAHCGCFGALRVPSTGSPTSDFTFAVARNALLVGALVLGVGLARPTWSGWSGPLRDAVLVGAVTLLGALYLGARSRWSDVRERLEAMTLGHAMTLREGWRLHPGIELLTLDGRRTCAGDALRAGDHVLFFSPHCPVCRTSSAWWPEWARRLAARGARLRLVSVEDGGDLAAFVSECGFGSLEPLVFRRPVDSTLLGVTGVPTLMVLGEELEVAFVESQCRGPTLPEALELADRHAPGTADAVYDRILAAAVGEGAALGDRRALPQGTVAWTVQRGGATVGRMVVTHTSGAGADSVEAAVVLDEGGRVLRVVPVSAGGGITALDPGLSVAERLRGVHLSDAIATAALRANDASPESRAWLALEVLLKQVAAVGGTR